MFPRFKKHIFDPLDAAGNTPGIVASHGGGYPPNHTVQAAITGEPTTCTAKLQGRLAGGLWADLSSVQNLLTLITSNGAAMFHVDQRPVQEVRCSLVELDGGTDPEVTFSWLGVHKG
jgi:hypothetical protein